jgi:hypothetical protein
MRSVTKGSIGGPEDTDLLIDDLDGSEAEGTVRFGLDGAEYEIDLNAEHAQALRDALARYVRAARRAGGSARRPARGGRRAPAGGVNNTEVRVGQGAGHRGEGPRTSARRAGGQVQGRHRTVGSGTFPVAGATSPDAHAELRTLRARMLMRQTGMFTRSVEGCPWSREVSRPLCG